MASLLPGPLCFQRVGKEDSPLLAPNKLGRCRPLVKPPGKASRETDPQHVSDTKRVHRANRGDGGGCHLLKWKSRLEELLSFKIWNKQEMQTSEGLVLLPEGLWPSGEYSMFTECIQRGLPSSTASSGTTPQYKGHEQATGTQELAQWPEFQLCLQEITFCKDLFASNSFLQFQSCCWNFTCSTLVRIIKLGDEEP